MEEIYAPESIDGSEGLLAIVIPPLGALDQVPQTRFYTHPGQPLQLAQLMRGVVVAPHTHLPCKRVTERTQEALFVRSGWAKLIVYSSTGEMVREVALFQGYVVLLVGGGHALISLDKETDIVEVKMGPYPGRDRDKRDIKI